MMIEERKRVGGKKSKIEEQRRDTKEERWKVGEVIK